MNKVIQKKMQLFILAIIILIMICLLCINHYKNTVFVSANKPELIVDNSDHIEIEHEDIVKAPVKKKNNINLNKVKIKVKINNNENYSNILSVSDVIDIEVKNIKKRYKLYYKIVYENSETEYKLFNSNILKNIETPNEFKLKIKVVSSKKSKEFELGEFKIYDLVYEHNNELNEYVEVGNIINDDGTPYLNEDNSEYKYDNIEINKNIAIDNVDINTTNEEILLENETEDKVKINGNIHIIEETNLEDFDLNGYLFIDTEENVTINENILNDSNIYSITIKNNSFTLNEKTYNYDNNSDEIKIFDNENNKVEIKDIINNSATEFNENKELVITKDEQCSSLI